MSSNARCLPRLHELVTSVHLSGDVRQTLDALTRGLVEVARFEAAAVSVRRPDGSMELLSASGDHRGDLLRGGAPSATELVSGHAAFEQWGLFRLVADDSHHANSLIAVLTGADAEPIGFLQVDAPAGAVPPDDETMRYLDIFAVQARTAVGAHLERVRLQDQLRLAELGQKLLVIGGDGRGVGPLMESFAETLRRELGALRVVVRVAESSAELSPGSWISAVGPVPPQTPMLVSGMNSAARVGWRRQSALVIGVESSDTELADQIDHPLVAADLLARDATSVLVAPIGAGADFFGYVCVVRDASWPAFSDAETRFAWQAARDLGGSLLNRQLVTREHAFTDHLRTLDENKRVLFSTIAHEFKGPIAAIAGHAELLEDGFDELDETYRHTGAISVASIARNARRLNDMVEDLMVLQEVEDPGLPESKEAVDLGAAVAEAVDVWRLQAEIMDVQLEVDKPVEPVFAWGGRTEVGRVVTNLISNAVKYSSSGGTVRVELEPRGKVVFFRCSDEGIGISAEDQARVFDQFFRGPDVAVRRVAGTGLGLSIVRRIVDHLGGRIEVDSALGKGSTFVVQLPAAPATGSFPTV